MIFSESQRFIFFAVPKTGTHTVREALRVHLAEGDWEQQLRYGKQLSPLPEIAAVNHGHVSYRQLSGAIGVTALSEFFRFGLCDTRLTALSPSVLFWRGLTPATIKTRPTG